MSNTAALGRIEGVQDVSARGPCLVNCTLLLYVSSQLCCKQVDKGLRAETSCKPSILSKAAVLLGYFLLEGR